MKDNALSSTGKTAVEFAGIKNSGYMNKKGTPSGKAMLNTMPPGEDISNQKIADINEMPLKKVTGMGYPGDGW